MGYLIPPSVQSRIDASEYVCGSDECGLGSWAGPLSVCAAIVPRGWAWPGVTDSKKLTRAARERLYPELIEQVTYCVIHVEPLEFDALGAGAAYVEAHTRAIAGALKAHQDKGDANAPLTIIDGTRSVAGAIALPKADLLVPAVSAASIIAKVNHDRAMVDAARKFPHYFFDTCMGYGTPRHQEALRIHGPCPIHRKTYEPMASMLQKRAGSSA